MMLESEKQRTAQLEHQPERLLAGRRYAPAGQHTP